MSRVHVIDPFCTDVEVENESALNLNLTVLFIRDSKILDKALEDFKDVVTMYKLEEMTKKYAETVSDVVSWSSQFKSGHQPGRGEYFHFFPCCECE